MTITVKAGPSRSRRAEDHHHQEWVALADNCARYCAQFFGEFTCDDVWGEINLREDMIKALGGEPPSVVDNRAFGPVMAKLSRAGIIERTGEFVTSTRRSRNVIPVWRYACDTKSGK